MSYHRRGFRGVGDLMGFFLPPFFWSYGRVVRQWSATPFTAVRVRLRPLFDNSRTLKYKRNGSKSNKNLSQMWAYIIGR